MSFFFYFFFFNDTATTEIYTLSLHDALPILRGGAPNDLEDWAAILAEFQTGATGVLESSKLASGRNEDRKSTRLNSSHQIISYAVFCLKKKKKKNNQNEQTTVKDR